MTTTYCINNQSKTRATKLHTYNFNYIKSKSVIKSDSNIKV